MPSWKNERLFFFVFLSKTISDILPSRTYQKKKSDGDYNVKRLTRRLTRIKSEDARNIIRNGEMKYGNKQAFAEAVTIFPILIFALFPFFRFRNILFEFPFFLNLRDANMCLLEDTTKDAVWA